MDAIVYLHGFLSSGRSAKSQEIAAHLAEHFPEIRLIAPDLDDDPENTYLSALQAARSADCRILAVVGSSLGGFWTRMLASEISCKAVLINPVISVTKCLPLFAGRHVNPHTGKEFFIDADSIPAFHKKWELPPDAEEARRTLVILGMKDEVLDAHLSETFFESSGCRMFKIENENHRIEQFSKHCAMMMDFILKNDVMCRY